MYLNTVFKYNVFKYCPALIMNTKNSIYLPIRNNVSGKQY